MLFYNLLYIILNINIVSAIFYYDTNSQNLFKYQETNMRPFYASKHFCSYEFISLTPSYNKNITTNNISKINEINNDSNYTDIIITHNTTTLTLRTNKLLK